MKLDFVDDIMRDSTSERMTQSYLGLKDLSYSVVEDGFVLPYRGQLPNVITGGVVTKEKEFLQQTSVNETIGDLYEFDDSKVKKIDKTVVYLGMFLPVWGHCITDCLKKLWFFYTQEAKEFLNQEIEFVYVNIYDTLPSNFQELLHLCVPNCNIVCVREITQYKKIYIPDDSLFRDNAGVLYYTQKYVETIQHILRNIFSCQIKTYDKIYFSRSAIHIGKDYGEKRIEDVFKYLGYKIIYPEKLSFIEQVTLLQNCTHFAATEGSVSHNSLFCKPGTKVCIIRKCNYINEYQFMINQVAELDVTYVDSHLSICLDKDKKWAGPFFLYANDNLLRFAGIPHVFNTFSLRLFKKYAKRGYSLYKKEMALPEYYAMRLFDEMNTSYFCKNPIKRLIRYFFSICNLSIWVPIYKKIIKE